MCVCVCVCVCVRACVRAHNGYNAAGSEDADEMPRLPSGCMVVVAYQTQRAKKACRVVHLPITKTGVPSFSSLSARIYMGTEGELINEGCYQQLRNSKPRGERGGGGESLLLNMRILSVLKLSDSRAHVRIQRETGCPDTPLKTQSYRVSKQY